jgi:hypothetical protein
LEQADNKFKLLKESGSWNARSEQEEKILALQTEIKNLRKATKRHYWGKPMRKKAFKPYEKKPFTKKAPTDQLEKPSWLFKEPKEDEMHKPKMFNGKPWYFCSKKTGGKCNGQYHRHKPSNYKEKAHSLVPNDKKCKPSEDANNEERKLKLAKAYEATLNAANKDHTMSD